MTTINTINENAFIKRMKDISVKNITDLLTEEFDDSDSSLDLAVKELNNKNKVSIRLP